MKAGKSITTLAEAKTLELGRADRDHGAVDLLKKIGANNVHTYQSLADAYTALQADQVDADPHRHRDQPR